MQRIRKGDKAVIISGKQAGASATVLKVFPKRGTAIVEGLNKRQKHQRADEARKLKSEIVAIETPIPLAKLALIDTRAKGQQRASRISYRYDAKTGAKVRYLKRSNTPVSGGEGK